MRLSKRPELDKETPRRKEAPHTNDLSPLRTALPDFVHILYCFRFALRCKIR